MLPRISSLPVGNKRNIKKVFFHGTNISCIINAHATSSRAYMRALHFLSVYSLAKKKDGFNVPMYRWPIWHHILMDASTK